MPETAKDISRIEYTIRKRVTERLKKSRRGFASIVELAESIYDRETETEHAYALLVSAIRDGNTARLGVTEALCWVIDGQHNSWVSFNRDGLQAAQYHESVFYQLLYLDRIFWSVADVGLTLGISYHTARRLIQKMIARGWVCKSGKVFQLVKMPTAPMALHLPLVGQRIHHGNLTTVVAETPTGLQMSNGAWISFDNFERITTERLDLPNS